MQYTLASPQIEIFPKNVKLMTVRLAVLVTASISYIFATHSKETDINSAKKLPLGQIGNWAKSLQL